VVFGSRSGESMPNMFGKGGSAVELWAVEMKLLKGEKFIKGGGRLPKRRQLKLLAENKWRSYLTWESLYIQKRR